ncbi:FecCD family ABC transporter permease [Paenibacillus agilis]|uniref:Iron ABC transporter permease n=1 Tax=Paenibacillus agilis TaxID=3020863 RepID=A0A559J1Y1_9BACL|nr:iron ABC transporter permease [Paenibacillus agilis]TVX93890.1 iron ABC transporter permease [Paenibacillus agilis]
MSILASTRSKWIVLLLGIALLGAASLCSLLFGLERFTLATLWNSFTAFDNSREHLLIQTVRVPATLIAITVGASFAIAGAILQAMTRNPLADSSLLGINSGSSMFIVLAISVLQIDMGTQEVIWVSFIGASVIAIFIMAIGSIGSEGNMPIRITLAGSAVTALASSVTSGVMVYDNFTMDQALFWLTGSVSGRTMAHWMSVAPYVAIGLIIALAMARAINVMAMGNDVAKGLGQRTLFVKFCCLFTVILLAGGSVALAGPIAFIGLMIPHMCRSLVGQDHVWLFPYCAIAGAILLIGADTVSRFILGGEYVPVGVITAFLGVPFLIVIARRKILR